MKKQFFFAILLFTSNAGFSQAKFKYSSINQAGIMFGQSSIDFQVQTINGVRYRTFFAGVGIAMDNYYEQTFPLFLDVRKRLTQKKSTPFIYMDAGYSFKGKNSEIEFEMSHKGGFYYAGGIGYEIPLDKRLKLLFDCGYSYKEFSREIDNEPWRSSLHSFDTYKYSLNRISIKAGLQF